MTISTPFKPRLKFPKIKKRLLHVVCIFLFTGLSPISVFAHAEGESLDKIADGISWVALILAPLIGITLFLLLHILPEKIAEKKNHPQAHAINILCMLSLMFGGILWPLAWIWAYTKPVLYKMAYGSDKGDYHEPTFKDLAVEKEGAQQEALAAVEADYHYAQLSIAAAVARNWYLATETWIESQLAVQMVDRSQKLLGLAKKRLDVGVGTVLDVLTADANLQTMNDGLQKMQSAYNNQLRALEVLAGRYPSADIQVKKELITFSGPIPAGIPLQILERRPDLVAVEKRFNAAFYKVGEAKATRLPNIKLTASLGAITSQVLQLKPDFSNPFGGSGATLVAPIYQGGSLKRMLKFEQQNKRQQWLITPV